MGEDEGQWQLVVPLPEQVVSMAQVGVDLASATVEVSVGGAPWLALNLPRAIDHDAARAKFVKKQRVLRITAPYA